MENLCYQTTPSTFVVKGNAADTDQGSDQLKMQVRNQLERLAQ